MSTLATLVLRLQRGSFIGKGWVFSIFSIKKIMMHARICTALPARTYLKIKLRLQSFYLVFISQVDGKGSQRSEEYSFLIIISVKSRMATS